MTGAARPLAAFPVFAQLPEAELELISSTARTVRFAARQRLFSEGQPGPGLLADPGRPGRARHGRARARPGRACRPSGPATCWAGRGWYRRTAGISGRRACCRRRRRSWTPRSCARSPTQDPRFGYALVLTLFEAVLQRLQATRARLLDLYGSPDDQR